MLENSLKIFTTTILIWFKHYIHQTSFIIKKIYSMLNSSCKWSADTLQVIVKLLFCFCWNQSLMRERHSQQMINQTDFLSFKLIVNDDNTLEESTVIWLMTYFFFHTLHISKLVDSQHFSSILFSILYMNLQETQSKALIKITLLLKSNFITFWLSCHSPQLNLWVQFTFAILLTMSFQIEIDLMMKTMLKFILM